MSELRLILLAVGALIIGAIWWWSRRGEPAASKPKQLTPRTEPRVDAPVSASHRGSGLPVSGGPTTQPETRRDDAPADDAAADLDPPTVKSKGYDPDLNMLLSVLVLPEHGERFLGADVLSVLEEGGLQFGKRKIFHREDASGRTVFSIANMLEPGHLDPAEIDGDYVHGLVLFAVLPTAGAGSEVFNDMLSTAKQMAARLHGELADADRSSLTPQTIQHLREKVLEFERRRAVAGA
jgi:cell division protein ZipA